MLKTSIIIPAWNLWSLTLDCLESIATNCQAQLALKALEVIVVDNGSTDETAAALAPTLERLFGMHGKAVRMPENVGFAKACNAGAKAASYPLLFFLNNDTLLTKDCLVPLIAVLESKPKVGIVGPLLLYPDDTVQHCGVVVCPSLKFHHIYNKFPATHPVARKERALRIITGAAMLMSAKLFAECDGFYEEYLNGGEDIDLCYSVFKKGLSVVCTPKSHIYHLANQTPGRFDHDEHNGNILRERHGNALMPDYHRIAAKDGFVPVLSPDFALYITIPEAKEKALTQSFSQNFNFKRCQERLYIEPFWLGGYELLADYYEEQNMLPEALEIRKKLVCIAPLLKHYDATTHIAARLGDKKILEQMRTKKERILIGTGHDYIRQLALATKTWAVQSNDKLLENLIEHWLQEYGKA